MAEERAWLRCSCTHGENWHGTLGCDWCDCTLTAKGVREAACKAYPGQVTTRIARKRRTCDTCRAEIPPGTPYYRHAAPPNSELNRSDRWSVLNCCGLYTGECRNYWTVDSRTLAGEVLPR